MLLTELRTELSNSIKNKNETNKNALQYAIHEIGRAKAITDEEIQPIIRRCVKRNEEAIRYCKIYNQDRIHKLELEISFLESFLPTTKRTRNKINTITNP